MSQLRVLKMRNININPIEALKALESNPHFNQLEKFIFFPFPFWSKEATIELRKWLVGRNKLIDLRLPRQARKVIEKVKNCIPQIPFLLMEIYRITLGKVFRNIVAEEVIEWNSLTKISPTCLLWKEQITCDHFLYLIFHMKKCSN
jgi:hypothetical protein